MRRIDLTGGTATGRRVAAAAAERLIPCTLELGGKTPVMVFEDCDIDEAVAGAVFASFVASGQTCVSAGRFLVQRNVYDKFVAAFAERTGALKVGDPASLSTDVGPVISPASLQRSQRFVDQAKAAGAHLLVGGGAPQLDAPLTLMTQRCTDRMIDANVALSHHFLEIAKTQRVRNVPSHAQQDHFKRIVQPLQHLGDARIQRCLWRECLLHRVAKAFFSTSNFTSPALMR